ncbi:MAG: flagellar motor protein MotB [Planctomycetota bacterium]
MIRRRRVPEESSAKVPAYIVTFSDMVTLLLTFFVMLLSLANMQDPELFNRGRESFLKTVRDFGIGVLFGGVHKPHFGHVKVRYFIPKPDGGFEDRTIDANEEEIRRVFKAVDRSVETMPSRIVAQETNFSVTGIRFARGDATLNEAGKGFLTEFCLDLQQDPGSRGIKLYVLGLAGDEATEKEQWIVSAKRAHAVAEFLREALGYQWPVYSWGAGPGGCWTEEGSPISRQSQVLIAILRK